ncbi:MAG: Gldg family protein [Gammaproteobacteria bacterium]|nr:Gldg family protein [Gammaproteobacteria bacterium]MCI0591537.1 Gldg family protein [Gammaproteobacteria bacterium]
MNRKLLTGTGLLLAAALFIAINILSNAILTTERLDLTDNKLFTLSNGTMNILQNLNEPINLRFYFSEKQLSGFPIMLNYGGRVRDMLEEYVTRSNGKLKLTVLDVEPFSEEEDQAVAYGLQSVPVNAAGDLAYFGLVGTNSTDDEAIISFFQPNKEPSLEYDLTKLIYDLSNPKKRVVAVLSALPLFGTNTEQINAPPRPGPPWAITSAMTEFFDVRNLGSQTREIDDDVDVLMVVHPKDIIDESRYAIDQYVLKGGKAIIFVDPLSEADDAQPDPRNPMALPERSSDLPILFNAWGLKLVEGKVAGDLDAAIRVQHIGPRGPQEVEYLPWIRMTSANFNASDFVTSELNVMNIGSAGILQQQEGTAIEFIRLIQTGERSTEMERDGVIFQRDPTVLLKSYKPESEKLTLAARISGKVKTAFPDGKPNKDDKNIKVEDPDFVSESSQPINVIVVADTDLLSDRFWVQIQDFYGTRVPQPIANNGDFVINALENLAGSNDLISLRSRGKYARPFERVEEIRHVAEARFRDQEQALQAKLEETERKIRDLQEKQGADRSLILTPAQAEELEKFRQEQLKTRTELRAVQHDLQKNIEGLGTQLRFINIGLVPLLIGLIAIGVWLFRTHRRA